MKNINVKIAGLVFASLVLLLTPGCKKDNNNNTPTKTNVIASLVDSGTDAIHFTYDENGNMVRYIEGSTFADFFYSGNTIVYRTTTSGSTVSNIDSFFYDGASHLIEVDGYDGTGIKIKSTTFSYNGDNTLNSASVTYVNPATGDELHNYTYTGGKLAMRQDYTKVTTTFKLTTQFEFLGYDNKPNPLLNVAYKYLPDNFGDVFFIWSNPYNVTSVKETQYDKVTGDITSTSSVLDAFEYNSSGLPSKITATTGSTTVSYVYSYVQI